MSHHVIKSMSMSSSSYCPWCAFHFDVTVTLQMKDEASKQLLLFHIGLSVGNSPEFLLLQDLNGSATQSLRVQHLLHLPVRSLPEQIAHQVLPDQLGALAPGLVDDLGGVDAVDEGVHPHELILCQVVQMLELTAYAHLLRPPALFPKRSSGIFVFRGNGGAVLIGEDQSVEQQMPVKPQHRSTAGSVSQKEITKTTSQGNKQVFYSFLVLISRRLDLLTSLQEQEKSNPLQSDPECPAVGPRPVQLQKHVNALFGTLRSGMRISDFTSALREIHVQDPK